MAPIRDDPAHLADRSSRVVGPSCDAVYSNIGLATGSNTSLADHMRHPFTLLLCLSALPVIASAQPLPPLAATRYVSGLSSPVAFIQDPSAPHIQYVVQQGGRVRVVRRNSAGTGTLEPTDYLTLTGTSISTGGERGLLGMACPVDYASHGRCYLNFTNTNGDTVIARFTRSLTNPLVADPSSRLDLRWDDGQRVIGQPYANHNGGTLRFGPDGHLYIGMGDGGSGNDPEHRAQDPTTLLGKMLRVDVHVEPGNVDGMRVPGDNPFIDSVPIAARPEIWAFGLRNPWKFAFDDPRLGGTGAMLIADVGQGAREEVDYEPAGAGGRNYGWRNFEGTGTGVTSRPLAYSPATPPIHDYLHTNQPGGVGNSISGGAVYRGLALDPMYVGRYFFADFVSGRVFSILLTVDPGTREAARATCASTRRNSVARARSATSPRSSPMPMANSTSSASTARFPHRPGEHRRRRRRAARRVGAAVRARIPRARPASTARPGIPTPTAARTPWSSLPARIRADASRATSPKAPPARSSTCRSILANATTMGARVVVRFLRSDGQVFPLDVLVPASRRVSINPRTVAGLETAEFSTIVESDVEIAVSRDMHWDAARRYGAHAERAVAAASQRVVPRRGGDALRAPAVLPAAESQRVRRDVDVTYLFPGGQPPLTKRYSLAPSSRQTLWINQEDPRLAATDVSAQITTTDNSGIVVERALYRDRPGQAFSAGHDGAGTPAAATAWYLAEGATAPPFDLFVLIANPGLVPAQVQARFLLPDGTSTTTTRTIAPQSRDTIWVDKEPGLAATSLATVVTRSMACDRCRARDVVGRGEWMVRSARVARLDHRRPGVGAVGGRRGLRRQRADLRPHLEHRRRGRHRRRHRALRRSRAGDEVVRGERGHPLHHQHR